MESWNRRKGSLPAKQHGVCVEPGIPYLDVMRAMLNFDGFRRLQDVPSRRCHDITADEGTMRLWRSGMAAGQRGRHFSPGMVGKDLTRVEPRSWTSLGLELVQDSGVWISPNGQGLHHCIVELRLDVTAPHLEVDWLYPAWGSPLGEMEKSLGILGRFWGCHGGGLVSDSACQPSQFSRPHPSHPPLQWEVGRPQRSWHRQVPGVNTVSSANQTPNNGSHIARQGLGLVCMLVFVGGCRPKNSATSVVAVHCADPRGLSCPNMISVLPSPNAPKRHKPAWQ